VASWVKPYHLNRPDLQRHGNVEVESIWLCVAEKSVAVSGTAVVAL
jgi:hypothetical protein